MIDKKRAAKLKRMAEGIADLDQEELDYFLQTLLNTPLPFSLSTGTTSVVHDDCDGDKTQTLDVIVVNNGDIGIQTNGEQCLRFRMPFSGGGRYPLVWGALRLLAFSIDRSQQG